MNKALTAVLAIAGAATMLSACSGGNESAEPVAIPDVQVSATTEPATDTTSTAATPQASQSMTKVDQTEALHGPVSTFNPAPTTIDVAYPDLDGSITPMRVGDTLRITGMPKMTNKRQLYIENPNPDTLQVDQRLETRIDDVDTPATILGLEPGVVELKVYSLNPEGNRDKVKATFTVQVGDGAVDLDALTGNDVAEIIATGNMREGDAVNYAQDNGYRARVVSINGQPRPITKDYDENRLNFTIENDVVTNVYVG